MIGDRQEIALDAAMRLAEDFEASVVLDPFIQSHPELIARSVEIAKILGALYQAIGQAQDG